LFLFRFRKGHAVAGVCIVLERKPFNTAKNIKCNINAGCVSVALGCIWLNNIGRGRMETEKKPAEEVIWTKVRSRKKCLKKCRSSSNRLKFAHVTWYLWGRG